MSSPTPPVPTPLLEWITTRFGGTITRVEPLERWRAGWFIDVAADGRTVELYARGARGPDFPSPYDLAHEVAVHELLEAHGFPVAHAHGLVRVGDTEVLVMDRIRGVQGLAAAADDTTRARLMLDCIEHIERMHRIPIDELARRGFDVPRDAHQTVWSGAISRLETRYRAAGGAADPVIEFLLGWLHRNEPAGRDRPAFVTWDAAQFLHADGRLTALIDFELAHVGDPYMDLAPLRSRDTIEPFGDLHGAFAHYEALSGTPIDYDVVRYFEVAQLTATLMLQRPVLDNPHPDSDLMTHIVWYVESARYALDVLAELLDLTLETLPALDARRDRRAVAFDHLTRSLHTAARAPLSADRTPNDIANRWRARRDFRLARHVARIADAAAVVDAHERADLAHLVGADAADLDAADRALVDLVHTAGPERDNELVHYFNRRMQRASMLLGPPDALLAQHIPLQALPDRG